MSFGSRSFARAFSGGRVFTTLLVTLSAALAALVAHVGIDVLGDYLLVHDTYDSVDHASRAVVSCTVVAVLAAALLALLYSIVNEVRAVRPERAARTDVRKPQSSALFLSSATLAALGLLVAMEAGDVLLAGQPVGDIGDLLGGSMWLGLAVTVPAALTSAFAVRCAARWAMTARGAAVRIFRAVVLVRPRGTARSRLAQRVEFRRVARVPALSRSASKRGPPVRLQ